jgi:predicted RND superfamily exporter protein
MVPRRDVDLRVNAIGRLAALVVRWRWLVVCLVMAVTIPLLAGAGRLTIIVDPDKSLPQDHPYTVATNLAERLFGNKFAIIIGVTPRTGDALQPSVITAVRGITAALARDPNVVAGNLASLAARRIKDISGSEDGLDVRPMLPDRPITAADHGALEQALARNPVYDGLLLSKDRRTASIVVDYHAMPGGFSPIAADVEKIIAPFRAPDLEIRVAGQAIFLALTEHYSDRMAWLFPLALVVVGLIHFDAFRSWQGLVLPLVTGLVATAWAVGVMGWTGTALDAFNAATPILILAVSAGHAVQILKRYYEEYPRALGRRPADTRLANREAIIRALESTGPVMVAAGLTAVASFSSLIVFRIATIRTFGLFTALGILSALILELTLIPALRAILPPPGPRQLAREEAPGYWDRVTRVLTRWTTRRPWTVLAASACFLALAAGGAMRVRVDNSLRSYFWASVPARVDDRVLNAELAGNNVLQVIVRGRTDDAIKSPAVLNAMAATQRFLDAEPAVGKTISLVDFIRTIDRAMNADANPDRPLPANQDLIAQYLLLYSMSGDPTDFDSYVDSGYRGAVITAYLKEESSAYLERLSQRLRAFVAKTFPTNIDVDIGGNVMSPVAINQVLVSGKLLNIAQIALAVFLVSTLLFRSAIGGAMVLVPLVMAGAANFGLMGWSGIPLQIATATVSAIAVGIGADYAIYMLYRIREEARLTTPEAAIERSLASAGRAVMFVATAIAGGYAVMMLSKGFLVHFWLGLLISLAMLVSAAAALTSLPALAAVLRPRFLFDRGQAPARAAATFSVLALLLAAPAAHAQNLSADDVMRRNHLATTVTDSTADATFTLIAADGQQRVRRVRTWTKLREDGVSDMRLTRFLAPPDIRGTATLTIENAGADDDIWIFLPALKRVRRLLSSNKKDSYVGSDFSYGDIIGFKVEDWKHVIVRQEAVDGVTCYVVESTPATQAVAEATGYSRRVDWVRSDNFVTVKGQYFDAGGREWKDYSASDIRPTDAAKTRWQPMRLEMRDLPTNHNTVIALENYAANTGLDAAMFSARELDREQ